MKKLFKAMAVIGLMLTIGAVGRMDFYTELMLDIPMYCHVLMYGGMTMMLPMFVYGILESGK